MEEPLDPEDLMDLEEAESYDLDDDDEEITEDPTASPIQQLSSGPASANTSAASSPPAADDFLPPFNFTGKPLAVKRGRGRPRREGGKPPPKKTGGTGAPKVRRPKPLGLSRSRGSRSVRQVDRMDFDFPYISPSALDDLSLTDAEAFFFPERERSMLLGLEDIPYAPETWPGKVCAFCNLGERSQLGQGEMLRLNCPEGFIPQRLANKTNNQTALENSEKDSDDRNSRGPVTCRRLKNFGRSRITSPNEYVDEFTIIGYLEEPSVNVLYETNGQFYVHRNCALWSNEVNRTENQALENVGPVVLKSSSKKCSFCNHFGASLVCKGSGCSKTYHFPCATASGAFQDLKSLTVYCSNHLGEAAMRCESAICYTCKNTGDIANLMYCSSCGTHYHGTCVGLAQLPGVRAGWQCRKCRNCQVCRMIGDESKLMTCEQCEKVYHASCQRPIVTSIPKYGWKCRCCRVCGDCGSRTPGAGLSSRWHLHYTVCDSCYQQRNKGCCCPICQRAYRSHAHREMVQCTMCRKLVHGTCDPEAELTTYQQKKESNPDYEYVCSICKNLSMQQQMHVPGRQLTTKRFSTEDPGDFSASQESLYDDMSEFDSSPSDDPYRIIGLGKGKPNASKIAKKRLGFSTGMPGRPKGSLGKGMPGKQGFIKRRFGDFGRKRGPKAKMRGVFGAPGVGLSRPVPDGKNDEEPGIENRLVLCSAKDKFVLTQDICVMCGALGTDQEGCLIACVQCGQCYHPYCINVKITKIILQKGWRCLDCTVCEGCGQRNDEGRLILCDDCDVSYHTYCMDPPLDYVPHGNWKCKWCACCRTCGSTDPGFNSTWMNGGTECGPCASHITCASCSEPYTEGDLIIQCIQCERWLHGICDLIKTDQDAEKCAEDGYTCILCRPRDVPPPHLIPVPVAPKPPTPTRSPEVRAHTNFFVDGVCLSESGHCLIKSLSLEYHGTRKKRKKIPTAQDKEAGIMATIESVVAGGSSAENSLEEPKIEMLDLKEEPTELYKEGMIWTKEDGPPPEGFTVFTLESGICVLRRKRQRNLQKLGIGGFLVRMRGFKSGQENDDIDTLPGQTTPTGNDQLLPITSGVDGDKPRKKPIRRKPKSKLAETFPPYLQEAFFGKDLLDIPEVKKEMESGSSDEEKKDSKYQAIKLSVEELLAVETAKQEKISFDETQKDSKDLLDLAKKGKSKVIKEEEDDNTEDFKDVLALPGDLLDTDLVNSIINEEDDEIAKNAELETLGEEGELPHTLSSSENSKDAKDELSDILGSHFTLESIPNINSKDVEDIFKGVLTDESQESQLSQDAMFPNIQASTPSFVGNTTHTPSISIPQMPLASVRPTVLPGVQHVSFPPSPYHSEYSNPQFSPAFSEPPSPWVNINDGPDTDTSNVGVQSTYNQRSSDKMKADEGLGNGATISAVLYANMNHPEWKTDYPIWSDRYKQIIKKWRTLSQEQKAPYLQQARDNRSQLRMKKQQQSQNKDTSNASPAAPANTSATAPQLASSLPSPGPPLAPQPQSNPALASEDQEKLAQQQKSAREAEQERQWKQLQALRQQQAQQQQHVIHEQRAQAIARVKRTISEPGPPFIQNNQGNPLQISTSQQELSPASSPSPVSRQFLGIKSPFTHPSPQSANVVTSTPSQSPIHEFQQSQTLESSVCDSLGQPANVPKPLPFAKVNVSVGNEQFVQQTASRVQFSTPTGSLVQGHSDSPDQPEVTQQLRDLLQKQHLKSGDVPQNKAVPKIWNPNESTESDTSTTNTASVTDNMFRQPLPPGLVRPRASLPIGVRPGISKMQLEHKLQNLDPRMRLILQQQQQRLGTPGQPAGLRLVQTGTNRPVTIEQYEQLLHQRQAQLQVKAAFHGPTSTGTRLPLVHSGSEVIQRSTAGMATVSQGDVSNNEQEIPDNVTAELEKLERETGTMADLQGVGEILGGLGDDDDELLAEMGADFNILEYADPELEALTGGKANILDLDLEEDNQKHDKKKAVQRPTPQKPPTLPSEPSTTTASTSVGEEPKLDQKQNIQGTELPAALPPKEMMNPTQAPQLSIDQNPENIIPQHSQPQPHVQQQLNQPLKMPQMVSETSQTSHIPPIPTPKPQIDSSPPVQQHPPTPQQQQPTQTSITLQQIHQQMLHQVGCKMSKYVQQAAAQGRPMPTGAKLQTPDGIVGIVLANNNVQLQIPPNFQQRLLLQLQNQKLQMRAGQAPVPPRKMSPGLNQMQQMQQAQQPPGAVSTMRPKVGLPAPPPPPYPGPPPPYPGNVMPHQQQEQPLLLEDLLEQEKREQEKQSQNLPSASDVGTKESDSESLLSDHDFERLKADVFCGGSSDINPPSAQVNPGSILQQNWQQNRRVQVQSGQPTTEITTRVQMFNANLLPAPPLPPENITTEQDKQAQVIYEQWLNHQNNVLAQQLKYYETEVQKLRKSRKSLNSKQRQLRKSGNQLSETDSAELQRISAEQAILQKHLESSRKQSRQHGMLIQEYRNKQQATKLPPGGASPQLPSPLGPPTSSPIHHTAAVHSPLLSPQQSPLAQINSPLHSPGPVIAHSPGPGSVSALLQSPGSVSPMQPSPRIGTPLSQSDGSPGPTQSPSQVCLPPPVPRMSSPQHRRIVTSPVGYTADMRTATSLGQMRFARAPVDHATLQQRIRGQLPVALQNVTSKVETTSPPLSQIPLTQQQLLQKQLHQQVLLQQQQQQQQQQQHQNSENTQMDVNVLHSPRVTQLIQHRNLTRQQPNLQQGVGETQQITLQQHHMMVQQLAKQQQQLSMQIQNRLNQQSQQSSSSHSPLPPKSPLHSQQIMSPHSMPASPMPPKSPLLSYGTNQQNVSNSPTSRSPFHTGTNANQPPSSPMMHQYHPPSSPIIQSPHSIRRPPSAGTSPAMPERPTSVENPGTPRTPYSMESHIHDNIHSGGGNPNNPNNPIPFPSFGGRGFGYFKLGLRGGSPMWSGFGRGEKRVPTPPTNSQNSSVSDTEKNYSSESAANIKLKKDLHLHKVSILKKKGLVKNSLKVGDIDDSSSTPPVTPPPGQKSLLPPEYITEKQIQVTELVDYDDDNSTILSSEVSLSSAVQQNDDEIEMAETLSQNDIGEVLSSPLEPDQISEEFLLFQENMVEEVDEEYTNIVIRSPTTSDDEFIMQGRNKKYNVLNMAGSLESPDHDANTEHSTETEDEELTHPNEDSNMMVMDQHAKSPEEQISTTEDFEELIDEGSRKEKILKSETIPETNFQKYSTNTISSCPPQKSHTVKAQNPITSKLPQKISLIATAPLIQNITARSDPSKSTLEPQQIILTPTTKISTTTVGSKLTSIILTHNPVRSNVLSVGPKLVSTSPAITIVSGSTSQIASILPSKFTVPVISASAVRQLPNVKVIDKPSSSLSLTTHDSSLPKKIFEDDSVSPDSSNCDDDRKDPFEERIKSTNVKVPVLIKSAESYSHGDTSSNNSKQLSSSSNNGNNKSIPAEKFEALIQNPLTHIITKEKKLLNNPIITNTSSQVIIHHGAPELKMTAQVIQETGTHMQITATETLSTFDGSTEDKSVVISIPSPTPSQEQMLDNIALQALENRRREFDSFEDVLDMIENMQDTGAADNTVEIHEAPKLKETNDIEIKRNSLSYDASKINVAVNIANPNKQNVPQLSPLSQPTELTTNMANASQQLRTLLSSLQTSTNSHTSNVETSVKTNIHKLSTSSSVNTTPIVSSRVISQAGRQSPVLSNVSTVIVPNVKHKLTTPSSPNKTSLSNVHNCDTTSQSTSQALSFFSNKVSVASQIHEQNKLFSAISTGTASQPTSTQSPASSNSAIEKKASLTLTAMLQNQPAATPTTKSSVDTITAASLLATPVSLSRTVFSAALAQAQPNAIIAAAASATNSSSNTAVTTSSVITSSFKAVTSTTNLLHTQLTKSRTKSLEEKDLKSESFSKMDFSDSDDILGNKQDIFGSKYSSSLLSNSSKGEDSQNVLLKKLLQNTACASTHSPPPSLSSTTTTVASLTESQKPSPPTLSSLLPPIIKSEPQTTTPVVTKATPKVSIRETSFVSSPVIQPVSTSIQTSSVTTQLHIDVKKCAPPSRSCSRDDLLSPSTPKSFSSQDSSLQTPPLITKKEGTTGVLNDIKKELIDETSQHSEISDHSKSDTNIKEEVESGEPTADKILLDKEELKKQKRRMYNQKRRQNQILNKESNKPNKRPRKNSKFEEDYDTYIDGVLAQLRHLPPISVSEPILLRNYGVLPLIGSGDMSKLGTNCFDPRFGELSGVYGNALVPEYYDYYNTKPYGDEEPSPEKPPASTQRGFYDQEFPLIRFDAEEKFDLFSRDDSPDSIVSSSSPECVALDISDQYFGLKLISDEEDDDENSQNKGRISPVVPIVKPIPIRLKSAGVYVKDVKDVKLKEEDKENVYNYMHQDKLKPDPGITDPVKENENIKVTLTLTSSAAEDIVSVLNDLANILQIPPPTTYKVLDRCPSPSSQKIGVYRTVGRDGKEGASIDIQSILNGAAKFCKHCDVVIVNNMIKKKVSDLPFLAKDSEIINDGEELYFCSSVCYMQFALMHRSPSISEDKAAAIIDHLSQKDNQNMQHKSTVIETFEEKPMVMHKMPAEPKEFELDEHSATPNFSSYFNFSSKLAPKSAFTKPPETKCHRNIAYKFWFPGCLQPNLKHKKLTDKEMIELLYQMGITVTPPKMPEDTRKCMFCQVIGDGVADGPARLLNFDVDKWVHLNCALWSDGVYETVNGALMNLENAIQQSLNTPCIQCNKLGATIRCFKTRCSNVYHLSCAVRDNCVFYKNKTVFCSAHVQKHEKDSELTTLSVGRRVYVNRDENRQVAAVMHHSDTNNLLRVGSLIFLNVGQLLPHQLQNFHTPNFIYPIGYKIIRFYWSMRHHNKRCRYICSIHDTFGRPEFKVLVQEYLEEDVEFTDSSPKGAWNPILDKVALIRRENQCVQMFPKYISGEDLFGLTEPAIVRVLESLPGIETLSDYKFKYGRNPLLELPLAINPTGAARTEPRLRHQTHWKRPHTHRTTGSSTRPMFGPSSSGSQTPTTPLGESVCPYSKQFVHSKSSQYKKMKQEWRINVYLARSKIQGLGLYAARDLEKHTMVIEYIGEVIRTELSECREKQYEAKNRGIYMFRLDDDRVVDATLSGGLARYINHSCNPNCVAETVEIDRDLKIIIFAKRRIQRGEELAYDYKFDIEDDQHKISCMCGAPNCRKWMN